MSPELSALEKYACPACGAQAEWNPTKQKLICAFCGTESPYVIPANAGAPDELDLLAALARPADAETAWLAERRRVQCQSCRAVMVFEAERAGQNCEFCGSPALLPYDEREAPVRPESLLPFKVDASVARETVREWWGRQWLAPNRLKRSALIDTIKGLYIPYWTFDAAVHCPWEAEAGHYYYVNVQGRDSKGRPTVRSERRVRWEPAHGAIDHVFDDEPVPGTRGVPTELLKQVEPFPTRELVAYDTAYLSGHVVERYQVILAKAADSSLAQMHRQLERLCAAQVPGDTHRNLQIRPEYSRRTFKHILVPVYLLSYDFRAKAYQVVVNGYTAAVAGRHPYSMWKILFLILLVLVAVAVIAVLSDQS
jgi:hypothetical protein